MNNTVNLTIAGLPFKCAKLEEANFNDSSAIYVILTVRPDSSWSVLDVGQVNEYGPRIDSSERRDLWKAKAVDDNVWVCVYPMPFSVYTKEQRSAMERALRKSLKPLCGEITIPYISVMGKTIENYVR